MLTYYPETFTGLSDFETAKQQLEIHREKVTELGSIIRNHGVHDCVGVALLHKHFELFDYERLVEGFSGDRRCCRPTTILDDSAVTPYMWKVRPNCSGASVYHPLEFLPTNDERLKFANLSVPVVSKKEFLAEMASKLIELKLTETFGISLLHRETIARSQGEILVETTDDDERELLFSVVARGAIDPNRLTQTLWKFSETSSSALECNHCNHCGHCIHCWH
jgi:hypothetical protein